MGSLSPHSFQGPRGCSRLSLWKKLLPNSYVLIMMAQEGAALTILGRKPVAGGSGRGQRSGPRGPQIHQGLDTDRHTHTHTQRHPPAKSPLVPDSARILCSSSQVEMARGGVTANQGSVQ